MNKAWTIKIGEIKNEKKTAVALPEGTCIPLTLSLLHTVMKANLCRKIFGFLSQNFKDEH
jgi:hypothetical protein